VTDVRRRGGEGLHVFCCLGLWAESKRNRLIR
jgi:hypothetical protein